MQQVQISIVFFLLIFLDYLKQESRNITATFVFSTR